MSLASSALKAGLIPSHPDPAPRSSSRFSLPFAPAFNIGPASATYYMLVSDSQITYEVGRPPYMLASTSQHEICMCFHLSQHLRKKEEKVFLLLVVAAAAFKAEIESVSQSFLLDLLPGRNSELLQILNIVVYTRRSGSRDPLCEHFPRLYFGLPSAGFLAYLVMRLLARSQSVVRPSFLY